MKFAYLILAHDAFDQLERLIGRLLQGGGDDHVFVHVDRKSVIPADFLAGLPGRQKARVTVLQDRVRVHWGHHSMCEATLKLLDHALSVEFDYAHLLSGRDWPLISREEIVRDISSAAQRDCFIDIYPEDYEWRMSYFSFDDRMLASPSGSVLRQRVHANLKAAAKMLSGAINRRYKMRGRKRSQPLGAWVKGSQWWTLPAGASRHVRDALRETLATGRLRFTQCSDEHVIPTALVNSPWKERLAPSRRYTRWAPGASNPMVLSRSDLDGAGEQWFARKFSTLVDDFFLAL